MAETWNKVDSLIAEKCIEHVVRLLDAMKPDMEKVRIDDLYSLHLILIHKLLRCHQAVLKLVEAGFSSEAASVAITEFEVYLDILYVGLDQERALDWFEHDKGKERPFGPVSHMIRKLAGDSSHGLLATEEIYHHLSAIKHANPVSSSFAFPIRVHREEVTVHSGPQFDAVEQAQGKYFLALSSSWLCEAFANSSAAFGKFHPVPEGMLAALRGLRVESAKVLLAAMKEGLATALGEIEKGPFVH